MVKWMGVLSGDVTSLECKRDSDMLFLLQTGSITNYRVYICSTYVNTMKLRYHSTCTISNFQG